MRYKAFKLLGIAVLAMVTVVGCGNNQNEELSVIQDELQIVKQENELLQEHIITLEEKIDQLTLENENLLLEIEELDELEELEAEELAQEEYFIYSADIDTYDITEESSIKIDSTIKNHEKLQQVANTLSERLFNGLSIDVQEIKIVDGQEIARINLSEVEENEMTWIYHYFQGSTGATIAQMSLEETLLQRSSGIDWIDGIELMYEGEPLVMDHVNLQGIIYR